MNGHRYVEAQSVVVQDVDRPEEEDVAEPPPQRDTVRLEEERRVADREVVVPSNRGDEDELDESNQKP